MLTALKIGGSNKQKCNDRHFLIIRLFRALVTLPTDVSKSCNIIYRNVAFTQSSTQKAKAQLKRKYAICLSMVL